MADCVPIINFLGMFWWLVAIPAWRARLAPTLISLVSAFIRITHLQASLNTNHRAKNGKTFVGTSFSLSTSPTVLPIFESFHVGCGKRYLVSVLSSLQWQSHDIIMTSCHPDICHDSWHKSRWCQKFFCTNTRSLIGQKVSVMASYWSREGTGSVYWPKGGRCGWG